MPSSGCSLKNTNTPVLTIKRNRFTLALAILHANSSEKTSITRPNPAAESEMINDSVAEEKSFVDFEMRVAAQAIIPT